MQHKKHAHPIGRSEDDRRKTRKETQRKTQKTNWARSEYIPAAQKRKGRENHTAGRSSIKYSTRSYSSPKQTGFSPARLTYADTRGLTLPYKSGVDAATSTPPPHYTRGLQSNLCAAIKSGKKTTGTTVTAVATDIQAVSQKTSRLFISHGFSSIKKGLSSKNGKKRYDASRTSGRTQLT